MTKYREILRLHSLGFSQQNIAYSSSVSKKTVNRVIKRAKELSISWPLDDNQTDAVLEEILFPKLIMRHLSCTHSSAITSSRMSRNGVQLCILDGSRVNRLR